MSLPAALSEYEQVVVGNDEGSGLHAIIAIHSTALGPALGGTRFVPYADLDDAFADALALARAMTYKNALAGLPHGGGKGVIVGDPHRDKTPEMLRAYGRLVASLDGRYVTAADVGTYVADMDVVATTNPWTTGRSPEHGGAGDSGDLTAVGVHHSLRAVAEHLWGSPSLAGRRFAIAGVGKVGRRVAEHVLAEGGRVLVADVDATAIGRLLHTHPEAEVADHPGRPDRGRRRRARAVRARRDHHRRGRRPPRRRGGLRRRQQPARRAGPGRPPGRARRAVRARLPGQRGRRHRRRRGVRRPRHATTTRGPGSGRAPSARPSSRCSAPAHEQGVTPLVAAERLAEARIAAAPPREPFAAPGA